jgi:ATP-dependent exoDNAse (exonuclease V) alpha subunit
MEVMVLLNMATKNDVANGSRGIVHDIVLDEREPECEANDDGEVILRFPPALIVFRPHRSTVNDRIGDLEPGLLPIVPTQTSFTIRDRYGQEVSVKRRQFSLAPAYAFTDFKSQGQTLKFVVVDLAKPLNGRLDGFHVYVALSRSPGRDYIRLLRLAERKHFTTHPSQDLREEDARLELLCAQTTRDWMAATR